MSANARLALGTAQLGAAYGVANRAGALDEANARAVLQAAIDAGINCLDTAPAYGESEARIGRFLADTGVELRIVTKLTAPPAGLSSTELAAHVEMQLTRSLRALRVPSVYALLLHSPESLHVHGARLIDALREAQARGRIQHWGLSVYDPKELAEVVPHSALTAVQYPFNLFDRRFVAPGSSVKDHTTLRLRFARSALLQGLFSLAPDAVPGHLTAARPWLERLRARCAELELDPVQAAIDFARTRSQADYVVIGAESVTQVREWTRTSAPAQVDRAQQLAETIEAVPAAVYDPRQWKVD